MAEKIEFIPAANLPTTEAEEVDVLCVEGGELKRRAAAGLGNGGETMDIVLRVSALPSELFYCNSDGSKVTILEGSVEAVRAAVAEGRIPKGKVVFAKDDAVCIDIIEAPLSFRLYGSYIFAACLVCEGYNLNNIHTVRFQFNDAGVIKSVYHYSAIMAQQSE